MKNKIYVYSKNDFKLNYLKHLGMAAFISIEATPGCRKYLEKVKADTDNDHFLESGPNVLNLEFDDVTKDRTFEGSPIKAMTLDQGAEIIDFVDSHLGMDLVIHCKAGLSRSQGVAASILYDYGDYYDSGNLRSETANPHCRRMVTRAWFLKHWSDLVRSTEFEEIYEKTKGLFDKNHQGYLIGVTDGEYDWYWTILKEDGKIDYISCAIPLDMEESKKIDHAPGKDLKKKVEWEILQTAKNSMENQNYDISHPLVEAYIQRPRILKWYEE